MNDVQGTSAASVVWGDATLVCISCHDPHESQINENGKGLANLRKPVKLSYNSRFVTATNPRGGLNTMMDRTAIPTGVAEGNLCLFCHQGRESGYTVYLNITEPWCRSLYQSKPGDQGRERGLASRILTTWKAGPFSGARTTGNSSRSAVTRPRISTATVSPRTRIANCGGCHMGEASANDFEGGHTWRPRIEVCQQCHGTTIKTFQDIKASADYNGNGIVESAFAEIGTVNDSVIGTPNSGLFGQLVLALQAKGIWYNPNGGGGHTSSRVPILRLPITAWTTNTLTASFNLAFMYKAGGCAYVHNVSLCGPDPAGFDQGC